MNSFGRYFRVTVFGASHGACVGVTVDSPLPGLPLSAADFEADLVRRRAGRAGTTARHEADEPKVLSGLLEGVTTGAPLTVVFENREQRPDDYFGLLRVPRPGHADFTAAVKYNYFNDPYGGGMFSGRMTLALVAAGTVARKVLGEEVCVRADLVRVAGEPVCGADDPRTAELVAARMQEGDSCGGVVECVCEGVPAGWGDPFFDSLESRVAHLAFSVPGIRGVEFGDGFRASDMRGSEHNDPYVDARGHTSRNGAGGVNGGISNGNPLVFRVAVKPTSSIVREQQTYDFAEDRPCRLSVTGRHDACFALRVPVVIESIAAIALAESRLAAEAYRVR